MQYRLRTLTIVLALGPPLATCPWWIAKSGWTVHSAAGAVVVLSYPVAVLLVAAQFRRISRDGLRERPKYSPLSLAAIVTAGTAAAACLVFFCTLLDRGATHENLSDYRHQRGVGGKRVLSLEPDLADTDRADMFAVPPESQITRPGVYSGLREFSGWAQELRP